MSVLTEDLKGHWARIEPLLKIQTEPQYEAAVERLNELLDGVGEDEEHPLYGLLETLSIIIEAYELEHYPIPDCSGVELLRYLMTEHDLRQSDLPEV